MASKFLKSSYSIGRKLVQAQVAAGPHGHLSLMKYSTLVKRASETSQVLPMREFWFPETHYTKLENGMQIASEDTCTPTCTVGLFMEAGSRFESEQNNGAAYFVEHLIYKGTNKRTALELEREVAKMGAVLNAQTSREETVFTIKCLSKDVPHAVELLSDVVLNSKFDEEEIERTRKVVLDELDYIENNDFKQICFDYMFQIAYQQTDMEKSIYGTTQSVSALSRQDIVDYVSENFKAPRAVLAVAGAVNHNELVDLTREHFQEFPVGYEHLAEEKIGYRFTGSEVRHREDHYPLCHLILALEGPAYGSRDRIVFELVKHYMGSWDRSHGGGTHLANYLARTCADTNICQGFESFYLPQKYSGLWGTYFVCDRMNIEEMTNSILKEWRHLALKVSTFDLERAQNIMKTNEIMKLNSTTAICEDIGRQILQNGAREPLQEYLYRIETLNEELVRQLLLYYLYDRCHVAVGLGPVEQMPTYVESRLKTWSWFF